MPDRFTNCKGDLVLNIDLVAHVTEDRPVFRLAESLGEQWEHLRATDLATNERMNTLRPLVEEATTGDVAFVVFGSAARKEITKGSDLDWTLLIDGLSDPAHFDSVLEIERRLVDAELKSPGTEGTFGGLAFSHEVLHRIGGSEDTNRNMTQRILLLLESAPVGNREAYDRVVRNILTRYIAEDWGWIHGRGPAPVPRFLQNDLARYWRTVAVDFAYKRRDRGGKGWALRTVKLRLSRKLTYAAGLLACFSCDLEDVVTEDTTGQEAARVLVVHLEGRFSMTPLDMVAVTVLGIPELNDAARSLFGAYNEFLGLLDDDEKRVHLERLEPKASDADPVYNEARELSHKFQAGLDGIFFESHERLSELTRIYGVF